MRRSSPDQQCDCPLDLSGLRPPQLPLAEALRTLEPVREIGPLNIVLVRHGFSERNAAAKLLRKNGANREKARKVRLSPDNLARLTTIGRKQAIAAGRWLMKNLDFQIDVALCSHFVRARETAGLIGLEMGLTTNWYCDSKYGERWWGDFDRLPDDVRLHQYQGRTANARYWTPPGGESLRFVEICARSALGSLYRKYPNQNILIVAHGEFITAMRAAIERFSDEELNAVVAEGVPNCGIVHYTRERPGSKEWSYTYDWVRHVNPANQKWEGACWSGNWRDVQRPSYSSSELLKDAEHYPRLLEGI